MAIGWDDQIESEQENNDEPCGHKCQCDDCRQFFIDWRDAETAGKGECLLHGCECPYCIFHSAICKCSYCREILKLNHSGAGLQYTDEERLALWNEKLPMKFTGEITHSFKRTAKQQK